MVRAGVNEAKAHVTLKMQDLEGLAQVVDGIRKKVGVMEARLYGRVDTVEKFRRYTSKLRRNTVYS